MIIGLATLMNGDFSLPKGRNTLHRFSPIDEEVILKTCYRISLPYETDEQFSVLI